MSTIVELAKSQISTVIGKFEKSHISNINLNNNNFYLSVLYNRMDPLFEFYLHGYNDIVKNNKYNVTISRNLIHNKFINSIFTFENYTETIVENNTTLVYDVKNRITSVKVIDDSIITIFNDMYFMHNDFFNENNINNYIRFKCITPKVLENNYMCLFVERFISGMVDDNINKVTCRTGCVEILNKNYIDEYNKFIS